VTGSAGLGDDSLEFVDLGLGTAESTEPLLGQLARALVLAVAQQFNDAALVRGEAGNLLDNVPDESGALAQVTFGPRDTGLGNAGGCLLYRTRRKSSSQPASIICHVCQWYRSSSKEQRSSTR
jgi:hypothetical protein